MSADGAIDSGPELIPISLVAHHVFCPRRAWLEAAGERTDTYQVAAGIEAHEATDDPAAGRRARLRAVDVVDSEIGITGRCDTLEVESTGALTIVEYKSTPVRRKPDVTEPMRVQLALQMGALMSMGHRVAGQVVYFVNHRVRVPVELDEADVAAARAAVQATRSTVERSRAPTPLEDDPRCGGCSHASVCLPDERAGVPARHRIVVADPDAQFRHLATAGSRAALRAGRVHVWSRGEEIGSIPLERIEGLVVHGNVDLSGALIREMLWRSLTVIWCTGTGRVVGWANPGHRPNGGQRVSQHLAAAEGRLDIAREFVAAKTANQATLLRRNGDDPAAVARIRSLTRRTADVDSITGLLGIEGEAAAIYFGAFGTMLKSRTRARGTRFTVRSGRPARDPLNAALNFAYALLLGDAIRAVASCGLDPHAGFLHHHTWPIEPGRSKVVCDLHVTEETLAAGFSVADAPGFWNLTNEQDYHVRELQQSGTASRSFVAGRYSNQEASVHAFDIMVADRYAIDGVWTSRGRRTSEGKVRMRTGTGG